MPRPHRAGFVGLLTAALAAAALLPLVLAGCGEKIAIPQANSIWANLAYSIDDTFDIANVRQLTTSWSNVFVLTDSTLTKYTQEFEEVASARLDGSATALCVDGSGDLVFVWEESPKIVRVFDSTELDYLGDANLSEVNRVTAMATNPAGMDSTIPGGRTFLYLTDPDAGLVHRYAVMGQPDDAFTCAECMLPAGVLAWPAGAGARSVHEPGGLATDSEGRLLVCETDSERNWVLRFDSAPDSSDGTQVTTGATEPIEAWAGRAVIFGDATCAPEPAPADYVLGSAAACNQEDWVGGPSASDGEFDRPSALAIDGEGKIYVADHGNSRVQIFNARGVYQTQFRVRGEQTNPISIGLVDVRGRDGAMHFAAFAFVLAEGSDRIVKLISSEHYLDENDELPPYEE